MIIKRLSLLLLNKSCFPNQAIRSKWIFKRVNQPLLGANEESPYIVGPYILDRRPKEPHLEPRETIDDLYKDVDQLDRFEKPPIKLILLENILDLGAKGEVVDANNALARFTLLPMQKAVYASPENLVIYKSLIEASLKSMDRPSSRISRKTMQRLSETFVSVIMNQEEPWTIEPWHIEVAFRNININVPASAIKLPSPPITGPDLDKQGKDFAIQVVINENERETVNVRCTLHHSNTPIPYNWHRLQPRPAILPEQQQLLDSMFFHELYVAEKKVEYFDL